MCVHTGYVFLYLQLNLGLNYEKATTLSSKEEVGDFVKISCLNQRGKKHLLRLQTTTLVEFHMFQV